MAAIIYKVLAVRTVVFLCITLLLLLQPLAVVSTRVPQSGGIPIQAGSTLERRSLISWWADLNGCKDCGCCKKTMFVLGTGDCCSKCC